MGNESPQIKEKNMKTFDEKYGNHNNTDRYANAVADIGLENIKHMLPFTNERLTAAYVVDKNLNSIPIKEWDAAAGFTEDHRSGRIYHYPSPLKQALYDRGVNSFAPAQLVCILKEAARQIVLKESKESNF